MFSTKNVTSNSGRISPVIKPGMHKLKINSIEIKPTPYDPEAMNLLLYVLILQK